MPDSIPTGQSKSTSGIGLVRALVLVASFTCILLVLWFLLISQQDPYVKAVLALDGSQRNGAKLFRMNCAGCHGIQAQGLVGPSLREVASSRSDSELIKQVVSGRTPPMPSFELEEETMADLLAYLHSLS